MEEPILEEKNQDELSSPRSELSSATDKFACCVQAANDKKAEKLVILDVRKLSSIADYFIICHGQSNRQVRGIAGHIQETMAASGYKPLGVEGVAEEAWVLMDYGDIIVHVFLKAVREFYDLERLWADAPRITMSSVLSST